MGEAFPILISPGRNMAACIEYVTLAISNQPTEQQGTIKPETLHSSQHRKQRQMRNPDREVVQNPCGIPGTGGTRKKTRLYNRRQRRNGF
jgi:hypothetical protein